MKHTCYAWGCDNPRPPSHLMCRAHWALVPKPVQQRVYGAYVPGQCGLNPLPSADWHRAADEAMGAVAVAQGHVTQDKVDVWVERRDARHRANIAAAEAAWPK